MYEPFNHLLIRSNNIILNHKLDCKIEIKYKVNKIKYYIDITAC